MAVVDKAESEVVPELGVPLIDHDIPLVRVSLGSSICPYGREMHAREGRRGVLRAHI